MDPKSKRVGTGLVGAPACGDVMKLQIEVGLPFHFSIIWPTNAMRPWYSEGWRWREDCGRQVQDLWLRLCHRLFQVWVISSLVQMPNYLMILLTRSDNFIHQALPRSGSRGSSWPTQPRSRTATLPRFSHQTTSTCIPTILKHDLVRNCHFLLWSCTAPCWLRMPFRWQNLTMEYTMHAAET